MSELYRLLVKSKDTRFAQFSQQILPDIKERFRIYNKIMRQQYKSSIKRTVIFEVSNAAKKIESPQSDVKPNDTSCLVLKDEESVRAPIDCEKSLAFGADTNKCLSSENNAYTQTSGKAALRLIEKQIPMVLLKTAQNTTDKMTNKIDVFIDADKSREFKEEDSAKVVVEKLNELRDAQFGADDVQKSKNLKLIESKKINKCIKNEWEKAFHDGCVRFDDEMTKSNVKELLRLDAVENKTFASKYIDKRVGMIRGKKLELNILKRTNEELNLNFDKKTKRKLKDYGNFEINGIVDGIDTKNSCILEIKTRNSKNVNYYMPTESDQLQGLAYMDIFNCEDCLFAICDAHGQLYFNFFKLDEEEFNFRIKDKLDSLVNGYVRNLTERTFASLIIEANLKELLE